ncbi:riboflavin synthase alpha chain RibE [Clostridium aceticum]|uniref:Riboflavin synthase n=1 Tax=Clostridium aceticum TaxID=84022 RepID=A0A0D8IE13_9CLOT|nr:riboflavin synthase [Clostridium aceticum]AKL96951.1 riboflavin synthase alpha chain RibE [Clostridium aceticum]KJF27421.1 riboflavin synthase subunit alpha [Clostridium aceticum]
MFTGIVEEIGKIRALHKSEDGASIVIEGKKVLQDVKLGDSIATNGVCLTVNYFDSISFRVDVMAETMRRSNLGALQVGSPVNLERALAIGDRLGGHLVSGHIDGVGRISHYEREGNAIWVTIDTDKDLLKYIILKGSIAIDGTSLTVAYVEDRCFKVSIIPHTRDETILVDKAIGETVNLECDMIGKYIERLMTFGESRREKKDISLDFLAEHGFIR